MNGSFVQAAQSGWQTLFIIIIIMIIFITADICWIRKRAGRLHCQDIMHLILEKY